jgi:hypothetical protein
VIGGFAVCLLVSLQIGLLLQFVSQYCNYNDAGIGFPRDCGPEKFIPGNWNSLTRGGQSNYAYYVWKENTEAVGSFPLAVSTKAQKEVVDLSQWIQVYDRGIEANAASTDPSKWAPGSEYVTDPVWYVRRLCPTCPSESHRDIVYKRISAVPENFNAEDLFLSNWFNTNNLLNQDFELYGSMEEAVDGLNPWQVRTSLLPMLEACLYDLTQSLTLLAFIS